MWITRRRHIPLSSILHVLVMWALHRVITHWLYYMYLLCEITSRHHTLAILHVLVMWDYTELSHNGYITCTCYVRFTPNNHTLAILHVLVMWDYIESSHTGYTTCTCYVRLHRFITHWLYYMYLLCKITSRHHTLAILHVLVMWDLHRVITHGLYKLHVLAMWNYTDRKSVV